ncbi:MAG: AraC family transcriptional regulator [Altererythrobacter sp.]|nr:helix-turn-helix domain-containing protein [Altererythrobacter sp.]MBT8432691.1 helix-turn-helix domain-containing protein [Altererythrobacter sp.]NNE50648.1 AraC family transcriptional regulator [Altererythrobacter sp.]NNF94884.1 AraC family transcriptional regulator [Altererythrobacter sp.]NNK46600.1 AraC family transcriptional regulator [Altererythrobacter sp.]
MDQLASAMEAHEGEPISLTSSRHFQLDYLPVPTQMSAYITTLYHYRCEERDIRDVQPAAIGHLAIFPYGEGKMQFRDGSVDPSNAVNLLTPFSVAAPFMVDGPFHAIGAVLTPLGWASLTGLDASAHGNRLYRAADWLGDEIEQLGLALCEAYRAGEKSGPECASAICDFIGNNLKPVNARHAKLIKNVNAWLSEDLDPPLEKLFERANYSERQVQRLAERFFGLPPQSLLRKYRALRAAGLLSLPMLTPEFEAKVREAFYDQSHMIREIRLFAGRTPARLTDEESPYLAEMLDLRNFREIDSLGPED